MKSLLTRRRWLQVAGSAGFTAMATHPLQAWTATRTWPKNEDGRRLVLLYLNGGNDGLNTVVPFEDDLYQKARPKLGMRKKDVVQLSEQIGLHPSLSPWRELFEDGHLTILRDVGYPDSNRSHFVSQDIWHSGMREPGDLPSGWVGRAMESELGSGFPAVAIGVQEAPLILRGPHQHGITLQSLNAFKIRVKEAEKAQRLAALQAGATSQDGSVAALQRIARSAANAYEAERTLQESLQKIPAGEGYPQTRMGQQLQLAARLIRANLGPPVVWLEQGGYDTHAIQSGTHAALLQQLGASTAAFLADLQRDGTDQRTLLLIYSEFGRRIRENGSQGTDHGEAGPMFAIGGQVQGGITGEPSRLDQARRGDVPYQLDFRHAFHEAAAHWLGWKTEGLFQSVSASSELTFLKPRVSGKKPASSRFF